jgi:hypothetical protein
MVNKVLRQTLELKVINLAVGFSVKLWKMSDRALWRSWPLPNKRGNGDMPMGYLGRAVLKREQCDMTSLGNG